MTSELDAQSKSQSKSDFGSVLKNGALNSLKKFLLEAKGLFILCVLF